MNHVIPVVVRCKDSCKAVFHIPCWRVDTVLADATDWRSVCLDCYVWMKVETRAPTSRKASIEVVVARYAVSGLRNMLQSGALAAFQKRGRETMTVVKAVSLSAYFEEPADLNMTSYPSRQYVMKRVMHRRLFLTPSQYMLWCSVTTV